MERRWHRPAGLSPTEPSNGHWNQPERSVFPSRAERRPVYPCKARRLCRWRPSTVCRPCPWPRPRNGRAEVLKERLKTRLSTHWERECSEPFPGQRQATRWTKQRATS
jgi:hypothetical protein